MNVTLRGLCGSETKIMEGFFDISYFLKGFVNLKPHWRGYGKSHIYFVPKKGVWRLESFYDRDKRAEFFANDENPYDYWPTGRSKWRINAGICQLRLRMGAMSHDCCGDMLLLWKSRSKLELPNFVFVQLAMGHV